MRSVAQVARSNGLLLRFAGCPFRLSDVSRTGRRSWIYAASRTRPRLRRILPRLISERIMGWPDRLAIRGRTESEQNVAARMAEAFDAAGRGDYPAALAIWRPKRATRSVDEIWPRSISRVRASNRITRAPPIYTVRRPRPAMRRRRTC